MGRVGIALRAPEVHGDGPHACPPAFHRPGWVYEEKVDWRIVVYKDGDRVRLVSHHGVDDTRRFADIAAAIGKLLVLDGEVTDLRPAAPVPLRVAPRAGSGRLHVATGLYGVRPALPRRRRPHQAVPSASAAPAWRTSSPGAGWCSRCGDWRPTAWRRGGRWSNAATRATLAGLSRNPAGRAGRFLHRTEPECTLNRCPIAISGHGKRPRPASRLRPRNCESRLARQTESYPGNRVLSLAHERLFGRPPRLAVADAGFASNANEQFARAHNVRHVVLPRHRRERRPRADRAALRWRTGAEGRISVLKRRHGLARCRYRGMLGMERWVGLGVIANNLLVLGRAGPPGP